MGKTVFTKSEKFKSEYSCAVVTIGELTPIEGSDFLAKTLVTGTQIVVRKDQVQEGDIMLYAANETQLNEKFLSVNNLYDVGCREKNANVEEVNAILQSYLDTKPEIEKLRNNAKNIKNIIDQFTKKSNKLNKEIKKIQKNIETLDSTSEEYINKLNEIEDKQEKSNSYYKKALEKTTVYTNIKQQIEEMVKAGEPLVTEAKKKCGFFNKYGRVRCITLKGEPSFGFLFSPNELQKFDPSITVEDIESYVGQEFDTVNGELFVKAYIPPVKEAPQRAERTNKAQKKIKLFDRIIDGTFKFHYDTNQLSKEINRIKPTDKVLISNKLHGTSGIFAKVDVRTPKKISCYKRVINKICEWVKKPKIFIDYTIEQGPVYSSRTVIKNKNINPSVNGGYYKVDIWTEWGDIIYPYLDNNMTVYGEIVGYISGKDTYIQKFYDYGCKIGENKFMPYRISTIDEEGNRKEWEVNEVYEWTKKLIERMVEANDTNAERIFPIQILYEGTLEDLYTDIDTENHWHENVLEVLKKDKEHFNMEMNEPLCVNEVPTEGFVLRIANDIINEAFKLKTISFACKEAIAMDAGEVDIEMEETNY